MSEALSNADFVCVQVELVSAGGRALSVQSMCGDQQAGLKLHMKNVPLLKEVTGAMWHSWTWLHDQGLPFNMEVHFHH